jgi:hypothetical protein
MLPADTRERRALLSLAENPRRTLDMLVLQRLDLGAATVDLRYVPDQSILQPQGCAAYLARLRAVDWPSPQALAATLFEDVNSELVPRWLAARLSAEQIQVVLQDARPNWSNPALLACLTPWPAPPGAGAC